MDDESHNDSLQQLFRRLRKLSPEDNAENQTATTDRQNNNYLLLIQHSLSFSLRQQAAAAASLSSSATPKASSKETAEVDSALYHRAGLRTPAENASRDLQAGELWLKHITLNKLLCNNKECPSLIFLRTSTRQLPSWVAEESIHGRIRVIDVVSNPFGWDSDNGEESTSSSSAHQNAHMGNLESVAACIEKESLLLQQKQRKESRTDSASSSFRVPLVVQSLTPLSQRHGLGRTIRFLKNISCCGCPLVVPVLTESLTSAQHLRLEDIANAVLCLRRGQAVLLRQGVRERSNLLRENLPFRIVTKTNIRNGRRETMIEQIEESTEQEELERHAKTFFDIQDGEPTSEQPPSRPVVSTTMASSDSSRVSKGEMMPTKVHLVLEEESSGKMAAADAKEKQSNPGAPRIYLQDDDPEFDDYDEEDPDDDLDI